jgi:hypothetical protein
MAVLGTRPAMGPAVAKKRAMWGKSRAPSFSAPALTAVRYGHTPWHDVLLQLPVCGSHVCVPP